MVRRQPCPSNKFSKSMGLDMEPGFSGRDRFRDAVKGESACRLTNGGLQFLQCASRRFEPRPILCRPVDSRPSSIQVPGSGPVGCPFQSFRYGEQCLRAVPATASNYLASLVPLVDRTENSSLRVTLSLFEYALKICFGTVEPGIPEVLRHVFCISVAHNCLGLKLEQHTGPIQPVAEFTFLIKKSESRVYSTHPEKLVPADRTIQTEVDSLLEIPAHRRRTLTTDNGLVRVERKNPGLP